jgi:hypothetical protein
MSRNLTSAVVTEITGQSVQPFLLFQGSFATGTVRAWSGIGDLSWNGFTWVGTGNLLSVSNVEETAQTTANGVSVTLNGIPSELISLALQGCRQGADGKIYLGFLNNGVVSNPILLFEGKLDVPVIQEDGESSSITISYESRLIDLERPRESRFTDEDQQRVYPGDLGFEFVAGLQDKSIVWGRAG